MFCNIGLAEKDLKPYFDIFSLRTSVSRWSEKKLIVFERNPSFSKETKMFQNHIHLTNKSKQLSVLLGFLINELLIPTNYHQ